MLHIEEEDDEEVQVVTSLLQAQAKSPIFETPFQTLHLLRHIQNKQVLPLDGNPTKLLRLFLFSRPSKVI